MLKKALIPVDFSGSSDALLGCLKNAKGLGMEEVLLLHVTDTRSAVNILGFDEGFYQRHDCAAREKLEERRKLVENQGFKAETMLIHDIPGNGIAYVAEKEGCGLIMMPSHGYSSWKLVLLGSTSSHVVEHAPCPVLVVRPQETEASFCCSFMERSITEHILYPTDFSPNAERAFELLRELAPRAGKITVFHVARVCPSDPNAPKPEIATPSEMERLESLAADLREQRCKEVVIELKQGCVRELLAQRLREGDVTMALMGTRGWGRFREVLLGSVSRAALEFGRRPILLVR